MSAQPQVLAVDDDEDIRAMIEMALDLGGISSTGAASGEGALQRLREGLRPSVILLDLMMPGLSGWDFRAAQACDLELAAIPVVVLSGGGNVAKEAESLGARAYLRKPVDLDDLLQTVRRYL